MTFIECCRVVNAEGLKLIRPSAAIPGSYELRDFTGEEAEEVEGANGWMYLDAYSASAVCTVYDAISPEHQKDLEACSPLVAVDRCWKVLSYFK